MGENEKKKNENSKMAAREDVFDHLQEFYIEVFVYSRTDFVWILKGLKSLHNFCHAVYGNIGTLS